ncbi:sugar/nucleoside kinase (ribokinase family) [Parabacteroides sp. PF5-5]|uniref:adenosine kinase n=1 Tax=unclassified Parabacteroides TaxID=2649774 RepID=UPI00247316E6|nr:MULTISPECIES: adenosine kinase [unclassified Parabacteroides]MDH6304983.1 sugar/nucleoside kinase (ribokinase family) [Parabacteroides sp. PH5-39]MDH6315932.1 sugar/nucleoside kinase (ribokinase family) [Parabacteroides sp. PF5-13]MDH6319589.1 sugar/nucleoside kinase (ribokinase family) [Parabacteroides sp. PH5-13]MDH6323320.1 sugar/nucleoside kinase (ribokinase family) [Parabacteroides sp. PH5-8]MDH6327172.1 sugar/nucleoside kinase (ribokinase family) [Parabacteroides sp. PH5-41]
MSTLGLGNALVDVLLQLEDDRPLADIGIVKGAMDMIDENQMIIIQKTQQHLERTQVPGGSVCNTMRAMANLGATTGYLGKVGTDALGSYYENAIREAGVTPYLAKADGISGCCTVLVSPDGERTMSTFLGLASTLTPDDVKEEIVGSYKCVYIEGYLLVNEPLVRSTMEKAKRQGVKVALDLSNFNIVNAFRGFLEDIIPKYVNILFSNESEAKAFTGLEPEEAIKKIATQVDISLVTLGKRGSMIAGNGEIIHVAAEGGKPLDTTGAGDHFAAGFLYGQSVGATFEQSARIGSMLAGYVIDVLGAQIPSHQWEQIKLKVRDILS